ncbi:MAG: hypothetical protein U1E47_03615 [Rivihabitans pingtungensis]
MPASIGPPETKNRRNVQAQRGHQHAGVILSQLEMHQRVGAVGVDHVFHAVGNRRARLGSEVMPPWPAGDAVIDGDGI